MSWEVPTMQSKTSFFNRTLFRKNLTRYWPLWGLAAFFGAQLSLALWTAAISGGFNRADMDPLSLTELYYNAVCYGVPIVSLVYAVLCAAAVWGYLYSARSAGFMHSLPIRREGLFFTNFLSGMVMMAIPYAVTGGITVLFSIFFRAFDPVGVLVTVLAVAGQSFFFFSMATLTAFITGSSAAMPILYLIFNFLAVAVDALVSVLAHGFVFGLTSGYSGAVEFLSPVVYLVRNLSVEKEYIEIPLTGFDGFRTQVTAVSLGKGWLIAVYAAAGVLLTAIAFILCRRRRTESAGDVVAVGWMKPVFLWGVTACAALSGGQAIYAMFFRDLFRGMLAYRVLPMAVCLFIAGAIGYLAAKMLLAKTLKVFDRRTGAGLAILAACCLVLCFGMKADIFGAERRVPDANEIRSASVRLAGTYYRLQPGADDACLDRMTSLHRELVGHKSDILDQKDPYGGRAVFEDVDERWHYETVSFSYELKNGRKLEREYSFYMDREQLGGSGTLETAVDAAVNDPAMILKRLHAGGDGFTLESGSLWLEPVNYGYDFSSRELQSAYEALMQDAAAGAWGRVDWFSDRESEQYAASFNLQFSTADHEYDYVDVNVYPEMTATLRFLRSLDFVSGKNLVTYGEWDRLKAAGERDYWDGKEPQESGEAYETMLSPDIVYREKLESMTPLEREEFLSDLH